MVKTKKFIFDKQFDGMPKQSDFKLVEDELPELQSDEFLTEAVFISVDPYLRAFASFIPLGLPMIGSQVSRIIESKNSKFPVGSYVVGHFGWQTRTVVNLSNIPHIIKRDPFIIPVLQHHPMSVYLGTLGSPGITAYFGLEDICKPKIGETVLVNTAGGAVGSHVGQICKILGCRVVGIAGSDEKLKWLEEIGFDGVINYKTVKDLNESVKSICPNGIDVYFDNVGGEMSSIIMQHMNSKGRVVVCGFISAYNCGSENMPKSTMIQPAILMKQLTLTGFQVTNYFDIWDEGVQKMKEWLESGKLKYRETVYEGFENLPNALIGILNGDNIGKTVVKI